MKINRSFWGNGNYVLVSFFTVFLTCTAVNRATEDSTKRTRITSKQLENTYSPQ